MKRNKKVSAFEIKALSRSAQRRPLSHRSTSTEKVDKRSLGYAHICTHMTSKLCATISPNSRGISRMRYAPSSDVFHVLLRAKYFEHLVFVVVYVALHDLHTRT